MSKGNNKDFTCDCTGLEYYGKTCEIRKPKRHIFQTLRWLIHLFISFETAYMSRRVKNWLRPSLATMHKLYTGVPWLWKIVNNVPFLHKAAMRYLYLSKLIRYAWNFTGFKTVPVGFFLLLLQVEVQRWTHPRCTTASTNTSRRSRTSTLRITQEVCRQCPDTAQLRWVPSVRGNAL